MSSAAGPIRPARVVLRVSDVEHSAGFYRDVVGLDIATLDLDAATLRDPAPGGGVLLELRRADRPGPVDPRAAGLFHTAFLYPSQAALGATLRRLAAHRIQLTGASDHLVSEALYLDDPDGIGIELYRDRPREAWELSPDGTGLKMATLPLDLGPLLDAPDITTPADGVVVGHVHLKTASVAAATDFWTQTAGLTLTATYGHQASFLASGGYHHHIGSNSWHSAGRPSDAPDGAGLEEVVMTVEDVARAGVLSTPDGTRIVYEA